MKTTYISNKLGQVKSLGKTPHRYMYNVLLGAHDAEVLVEG